MATKRKEFFTSAPGTSITSVYNDLKAKYSVSTGTLDIVQALLTWYDLLTPGGLPFIEVFNYALTVLGYVESSISADAYNNYTKICEAKGYLDNQSYYNAVAISIEYSSFTWRSFIYNIHGKPISMEYFKRSY